MDVLDLAQILVAAMTPIGELRLAIPYGVLGLSQPWQSVLPAALVGNVLPPLVLLPLLDRIEKLLGLRPNPLARLLHWRVAKIRADHNGRFLRWGAPALVLFVALPLPMTGAWTGTLAAWVFRVPYRVAIPLIFLGVGIAGALVTTVTVVGVHAWFWLLAY